MSEIPRNPDRDKNYNLIAVFITPGGEELHVSCRAGITDNESGIWLDVSDDMRDILSAPDLQFSGLTAPVSTKSKSNIEAEEDRDLSKFDRVAKFRDPKTGEFLFVVCKVAEQIIGYGPNGHPITQPIIALDLTTMNKIRSGALEHVGFIVPEDYDF